MSPNHMTGCMCDACIAKRTKEKVQARERAEAEKPYIARRGGDIGSVSVSDALKQSKR